MPYLNVPAAGKIETGRGVPQLLQNKRRTRQPLLLNLSVTPVH